MVEIDKSKKEELLGILSSEGKWKKLIKIVKDDKQYRVSIPRKFADLLNIDQSTDYLEFHLIPDDDTKEGFRMEAYFVRQ